MNARLSHTRLPSLCLRAPLVRCAFVAGALGAMLAASSARAPAQTVGPSLADLSIEELVNVEVTSVSKKQTPLFRSPAAVAVVTNDDVRRFGITTLPEALRLVAGMDVARINANEWAVSARGFNSEFATKLLVLIDGRSVYTPASAGVFWNAQDILFEDLDRIEVIRGPGATLWGANAVNGVINITTKSAKDTQGLLISGTVGTEDQPGAAIRYGGELSRDLHFRVYGKFFDRNGFPDAAGRDTADAWNASRGGFRVDWEPAADSTLTLQGDYYDSDAGKRVNEITLAPAAVLPVTSVNHNRGGNVLGRWTRAFSAISELTVQAYLDRVVQGDGFGYEHRNTVDLDLQHHVAISGRQDLVWGAGFRNAAVRSTPSFNLTWTPDHARVELASAFLQDEMSLIADRLSITAGSKFEHVRSAGSQAQPSVRVLWTPSEHMAFWASAARAIRTPAIFERHARLNVAAFQPDPSAPPLLVSMFGNSGLAPEKLHSFELGYRVDTDSRVSLDVSCFLNRYSELLDFVAEPGRFEAEPLPPHVLLPSYFQNALHGETHGAEISVQSKLAEHWHVAGSATWLSTHLHPVSDSEHTSPAWQFQVRSTLDVSRTISLSAAACYVGTVSTTSVGQFVDIPAYTRLDLGVQWRPVPTLEIGVWGQNLSDARHAEYASQESALLVEVPRSVLARATLRF